MKRAAGVFTAILAIAASMLAVASPASASHDGGGGDGGGSDYPPNTAMLTTPTPTTTRGAHLTLIASGFVPGATITFTIRHGNHGHDSEDRGHGRDHSTTLGTQVADANGGATLNTRAPQDAGKYTVTASSPDGLSASLILTVTSKPDHGHCPDRSPQPSHHDSSGHEQCGKSSDHGSDD